jgi:hypothetical protein
MKPNKSQQMMISDGLPAKLIIDQEERKEFWLNNPPKSNFAPYSEKKQPMTEEQIALLFALKESKERGAASLGCSNKLSSIAVLEKLGYAKQHGFGPTSFFITAAGLEEAKKHKKPEAKVAEVSDDEFKKLLKGTKQLIQEKTGKREPPKPKEPKAKATRAVKVNPNLSPVCIECGVSSPNRSAALDFLHSKLGKQQPIAAVLKAIYGAGKATEGATDIVIKSLMRDIGNSKANDKYELRRIKDSKGVFSYGLYAKSK